MAMLRRALYLAAALLSAFLFAPAAHAECGGSQQCIGVSINPAAAPFHGSPLVSAPIAFPPQVVGTTSATRTILVAGVLGAPGSATLNAIALGGANAGEFSIASTTCVTGVPSLLQDGAVTASLANTCAINVVFNPASEGAKSASVAVSTAVITRTVPLTGTTSLFVVNPSNDPSVSGLIGAQDQTVRRFSRAQISNIQRRMESLHRGPDTITTEPNGFGPAVNRTATGRPDVGVGLAAGPDGTANANLGSGLLLASVVTPVLSGITTKSLNLSNVGDSGSGSSPPMNGYGVWVGGIVNFGSRDQGSASDSLKFTTDGISIGVDRRISNKLALGIGLGYARDTSDVGSFGTKNKATGWSIAGYGSYQPTEHTYIDGLIGYGNSSHDMDRYVASVNTLASANRKGDQLFASLAAGYEYRREGLLVSPNGRLDYAYDRLKQTTESGVGINSLTYLEQTFPTLRLALGLRAESIHETNFGWALPRLRVEYRHDFENNRDATVTFANQFSGPRYSVTPQGFDRNTLLLGVGSDFVFRRGLKFGIDYQVQQSSGLDSDQAIRFWLSKDLDETGSRPRLVAAKLFENPVRVEAGYTWDDNVNRANAGALSDSIYNLNVSKAMVFGTSRHTQVVLTGLLNGEMLRTYYGLNRISGGVDAEFQYRSSGDFFAPTFGIFGRAMYDAYDSDLRSGYRYSFGLNVRQALSDRINLFAALARSGRNADSDVFDGMDNAVRFNLDYALGEVGSLYLGGEYRRGDLVSSLPSTSPSAAVAQGAVPDDAYPGQQLFATRYDADTVLWTLGYNLPLGPRDSLDISWRRAHSKPEQQASGLVSGVYGPGGGPQDYTTNQYSVFYLVRF
jgi:outer membrane autotransporter protein